MPILRVLNYLGIDVTDDAKNVSDWWFFKRIFLQVFDSKGLNGTLKKINTYDVAWRIMVSKKPLEPSSRFRSVTFPLLPLKAVATKKPKIGCGEFQAIPKMELYHKTRVLVNLVLSKGECLSSNNRRFLRAKKQIRTGSDGRRSCFLHKRGR